MEPILDGVMHAATATKSAEALRALANRYSQDIPPRPSPLRHRAQGGKDVILVTGTTGNFGCDLLEALLTDDGVELVYALNRGGSNALERQKAAFHSRELDADLLESPKFRMVEGDISRPDFGLQPELLDEIRNSVTVLVHNAWQVNFNLPIASFDLFLRSLRYLADFALSSPYIELPKIQYVSSITVFQSCDVPVPVEEEPVGAGSALGSGYGESKWVGEQMLLNLRERTGLPVQLVRLAQICGDRNGYWNAAEWFPAMVKSAFLTRCLPDIDGDAAFVPNYAAARALVEMRSSPEAVLHLTHPRSVRLRTLLSSTADELGIPLVSWDRYLQVLARCVKDVGSESTKEEYVEAVRRNPSLILLGFFCTRKFEQGNEMTHFVALSTEKAQAASPTLQHLPELGDDVALSWLSAWRAAGFLDAEGQF
ncbi:male sterility protein-domain-containing protein [Epithele typhae]|uniref:male sterility protein-domain-containing protein n=1 Tax=Epithele typhae TaxID=378194 RepID=UPI0020071FB9|nr:male sterility protein-domain-containing protein [Epithele typhae]KAH9933650.1 male sterility protein-domain-containing protein [Epithele typhae]